MEAECAACHQLSKPSTDSMTLSERIERKAPPLFYAGNKYQEAWLISWLQKPVNITPTGGAYWAKYVHVTDEGDAIKKNEINPHLSLDAKQAKAVSAYLMKLKPYSNLIKEGEYQSATVSKMLGEKDFRKFKGCGACHQDEKGFGGVTGPELYTATKRLQAEFIASYIRNPVMWEPTTMMPNKQLNDTSIYKLMNYLESLGGQ